MIWPPEPIRKRILDLRTTAHHHSSSVGESGNAFAALKRLQDDFGLDDVEINLIADYQQIGSDKSDERPISMFELVYHELEARHIKLTVPQMVTCSLWGLHSYVYDKFSHTPRLLLRSSEIGCGKTTLLSLIVRLSHNGFYSANYTPAVIYHKLRENPRTTMGLDEVEHSTMWGDPLLLSIIDAGHRWDGVAHRLIGRELVEFPCFAPLALAAVPKRRFAPQLLSRCIVIEMQRHLEGQDERHDDPQIAKVRSVLNIWASTFERPQIKTPFTCRTRDNWQPLVEIADTLGYGMTVRAVALAIDQPSEDPIIRLLFDIRRVFQQHGLDRIWTDELLTALHRLPDARWDEFLGLDENCDPHKLTRAELYAMLRTKNLWSRSVWKGTGNNRESNKGFPYEQFEPVWQELFGGTSAQMNKIIRLPRH
jgi:hypothetical protein